MISLKGHLLIASPSMKSTFFDRTVILMLNHSEGGAAGLILNRPTEATVSDIAEQVFARAFEWDKALHLGGPVSGPLMVLHEVADQADDEVIPGVFTAVEIAKVRELVLHQTEPSIILANYAGWGPGQLEGEFGDDSWITLPATRDYVFWEGTGDLWDVVVKAVNGRKLTDFLGLRMVPTDPSHN